MHDHAFHCGKFNDYVLKKPARTAGLVASAFMGLLLLPASKRSPVLTAHPVWMHIALAVLFLFSACLHVSPKWDNGRDDSSSASGASCVSVSRVCDANASEEHIALATTVFGAPAPVDGHITPVDEHIARAPAVIAVQRLWTSTLRQRQPCSERQRLRTGTSRQCQR